MTQATPNPVATGEPVRYAVSARNIGSAQSSPVSVRLEFPAIFTSPAASGSGFTCVASSAGTSNIFNCTSGVLASSQSRSLSLTATAPRTITGDRQTLVVKASVNPNDLAREQGRTANNTTSISTIVAALPDLVPSWTGASTTAVPGADTMFELTMRNIGDRASGDAVLKVSLPVGQLSFSRFANNQFDGGCGQPDAQGKFSCRTSSVPAGGSRRVQIWSRANPLLEGGDRLLSQATAELRIGLPTSSNTPRIGVSGGGIGVVTTGLQPLGRSERNDRNNTASLVTTVNPSVDLQVTLVRSRTLGCPGNRTVQLVYRVGNQGAVAPTRSTQLRVGRKDPCAPGGYLGSSCICYAAQGPADHAQNCSFGANDQSCPVGMLAAGASREFTLYVEAAAGQNSVQVQATVDPDNVLPESNEQNNQVTTNHAL